MSASPRDATDAARPLLSIIVPTHDTRALTCRCFAALAAQQMPGCELLLVDDASTDGTAELIACEHPAVRIVRLAGPRGFAAAANAGLAAARGELLWLLNSDTEVMPGALAALVAAFAAEPRLGIAGAALHDSRGLPRWSGGAAPALPWLFVLGSGAAPVLARLPGYRRLKTPGGAAGGAVDWVSGAALAIRRPLWERLAPLDAGFHFYCQDADLCLRARDLGWRVAIVPGVRVLHHEGATIGRRAGAVAERYHAAHLWTDLVRLVAKRSGPARARRARQALLAGAALRIAVRRLAQPLVPGARRGAWQRDTRALVAGFAALRAYVPPTTG